MSRFHLLAALGFAVLALGACSPAPRPPPPSAPAAPSEQLNRIVDRYWDAYLQLNPAAAIASGDHSHDGHLGNPLAPRYLADSLALERGALAELRAVPRALLDAAAALNYDIFKRGRELAIEGFTYPEELIPDLLHGMPQFIEQQGSGSGVQPFTTAADYENWISRIDDYAAWTAQAIANMRDGLRRGYVLPRELVEHALPALARASEDTPRNGFYLPLQTLPGGIAEPARTRLTERVSAAVRGKLLPAYRQLHDFLAVEYLPRARVGVALGEFPLGDAWYAHRLRVQTDGDRTPAQIHALGLQEVERVRGRLHAVLAANGTEDDLQNVAMLLRHDPAAAGNPDEAESRLRDLRARVAAAMPALFTAPPPDIDLRALGFAAANDTDRSGGVAGMGGAGDAGTEAMFLHYAVPGRLYQSGSAAPSLPRFRRFGSAPAFIQGWALYAESLGEELGLYGDLKPKLAALVRDLNCSAALVVDTGLQSQHWTPRRALDYLRTHTPMDDAEAIAELDRIVAAPGAALAPKIGELEFLELRARALQSGTHDLRAFHSAILEGGPMPLDILEARIGRWIAAPP